MDIKLKFTARFSIITALLLLCFAFAIYQGCILSRQNSFSTRMKEKAVAMAGMMIEAPEVDSSTLNMIEENDLISQSRQYINIYNDHNELVYYNRHRILPVSPSLLHEIRESAGDTEQMYGDTQMTGINFRHQTGNYVIVSYSHDTAGFEKLAHLRYLLLVMFLCAIPVSVIAGFIFSHYVYKPLTNVVKEVKVITSTNLHKRVEIGTAKDEAAGLATMFNELLDRIEDSYVMQKNFISNASHEFRTPLTAMKGQIEVMLMQRRTPEMYEQTLRSINEDINRLIELLQSLYELAKASADFPNDKISPLPAIELVVEARAELLRIKPSFTIDLEILNIPEQEYETFIDGNEALLKSVFKNLIENGCKFSPDKKVEVTIGFEYGNVKVTIKDEGIGIDAEDLKHVFEPFYRANDTRGVSGHGIGLSLVKKIVDLHYGEVTLSSEQGKGTIVVVSLPISKIITQI